MSSESDKGATQTALRHSFVSMLFALVVAEIAIQASQLFGIVTNASDDLSLVQIVRDVPVPQSWMFLAPLSHLVVVFVLISTSWVGWSRSIDRDRDVEQIFSVAFLLLLIELSLVVLYFVLAKSVELAPSVGSGQSSTIISPPSAVPEARWLFCIYVGYAVWDVFNDALPSRYPANEWPWCRNTPALRWLGIFISGIITRCSVSAICAVAAYLVVMIGGGSTSALSAFYGDAALLCVVIFFWLAKDWEPWIVKNWIPPERHRKGTRLEVEQSKVRLVGSFVIIPTYFMFLSLT